MIWNLDWGWFLMALSSVAIVSYILCLMLESSLGGEGYGPFGNAALITAGFFGAIFGANYYYGVNLRELGDALVYGIGGAFGLFLLMVILRAFAVRLTR